MSMMDVTDDKYRKALHAFRCKCEPATESLSLVYVKESQDWDVMPYQEAIEQGDKVFIALTCLQKTPYIRSENTNEKENQEDTEKNTGSGTD